MTVKYYDTFSITSRFTGYISNITIGDFYDDLSCKTYDSTAILGGLNSTARQEDSKKSDIQSSSESSNSSSENNSNNSSSTSDNGDSEQTSKEEQDAVINPENLTAGTSSVIGKRGSENIGLAVFNKDKLCGELTAVEAICHLLISNNVDSCIVSIDNPIVDNKKMEIQLSPKKNTKVNVNIKDGTPHISIDVPLTAEILTLEQNIDYENSDNLEKVSTATEKYMKEEFTNYLDKVSKEYNVDIDHFSSKAYSHFATISDWYNYNWYEKYKNAKFDVNIDINVISSLLLTKT